MNLIPDHVYPSIYSLDPETLVQNGIRLLLADLDNTLAAYGEKTASAELHAWKDQLNRRGITLFILSNSRKPARARQFAESLDVPYLGHAGKPKRGSFFRVMKEQGVPAAETAIVGDQIFTDIWGGNRAGVHTYLVRPLRRDTVFRILRYALETPFRSASPDQH